MKRIAIFIDEAMERDLQALARRKGTPVSALVRESLRRFPAEERRRRELCLCLLAAGRSGRTDISEHHEQLL